MIKIAGPFNSGAAVGADGVATNNADNTVVLSGLVRGVYVKYNDSPPAGTTDILITTKGNSAPSETILAIANAATDGWFYPLTAVNLNSDGSAIANEYRPIPISDLINVKIDGANAGDNIDVYLSMEY